MKFRQYIFWIITILSSAECTMGMEAPLQPVSNEKLQKKLFELPAEIRNEVLCYHLYVPYPRTDKIAERVIVLQDKITPIALLNFLRSFYYTANAIDLASQLQSKNLPTVHDQAVKEWLISAKTNLQDEYNLGYYIRMGNQSMVKQLLEDKALNLNGKDYTDAKKTALAVACTFERTSTVEMLLAVGANVNQPDDKGRTPLWEAAYAGNKEIVIKLLEAGAQIDTGTLYWAERRGHTALARMLFELSTKRNQK